jgi:hypothetical protein
LILGKITHKKWMIAVVLIINSAIFYFLDLDLSFLILGVSLVSVIYIYLIKKRNEKKN